MVTSASEKKKNCVQNRTEGAWDFFFRILYDGGTQVVKVCGWKRGCNFFHGFFLETSAKNYDIIIVELDFKIGGISDGFFSREETWVWFDETSQIE